MGKVYFFCYSRITSSHNIAVVQQITADIGIDEFNKDFIRGKQEIPLLLVFNACNTCLAEGCKTYRKTLAEKSKSLSTPIKKKKQLQSLKQRVNN